MSRVVLAMSGGVDSSVAAWLLRRAGHEVVGLFMRHGPQGEADPQAAGRKQGCCSAADAEDARRVAERLDIPFYVAEFPGGIRPDHRHTSWRNTPPGGRPIPASPATPG